MTLSTNVGNLRDALAAPLSLAQASYVLSLVRKALDERNGEELSFLRFFADWAFHIRVDRSGAKQALRLFDQWFPTLAQNESRDVDGTRFLLLYGFHIELMRLLRELKLPEVSFDWWSQFLPLYLELIAEAPASSVKNLGLQNIVEVAVERLPDAEVPGFRWRFTLATGDVKLLVLNTAEFFRAQPTHVGEPWLWKGPVAAVVGLPEGWVLDNEPGRGYQFCMYSVLQTRDRAKHNGVFLYGSIVLKSLDEPTMELIAERHERETKEQYPESTFKRLDPLEGELRSDGQYPRSLLRVGRIEVYHPDPEYTLYIDSPKGVLMLVMLSPEGQDDTYLSALKWIGVSSIMMMKESDEPSGV